ncbi:AAA family ATPase [Methanobrevibacter sp.]|uniref:AAA family ATPase n=1 Tax=Methanobrevibacter sp. TaxID=66852 RepID=UPI00386A22EB
MFIEKVELTNFRRFYGFHKVSLDFNDEKNVTIFSADNNSGKSTFVNALTWCLYGDELHDSKDRSEPYINTVILEEAEEAENNPTAKVSVLIKFYEFDEKGNKKFYEITRELTYEKWGDADWMEQPHDHVIFEDPLGKTVEDDHAELKINELIPRDMFRYFFFNGPKMRKYFDYDSDFNLQESIDNISQLDLIGDVSDKLKGVSSKLKTDRTKNKHDDSSEILQKIDKTQSDLMQCKENKKQLKKDQEKALKKKLEYEQKLEDIKAKEVKKLLKDRSKYETDKKTINADIKKNKLQYEKLILELFPICALFDPIYNSYIAIEKSIEKDAIPENIRNQLLEYIKDKGQCICGADLKEHPECIDEIEQGLKAEDKLNSDFRDEVDEFEKILKKLKKIPKIEEISEEINSKDEHLELIQSKLNKISQDLMNADEDKVREYEVFYNQFKDDYENYSDELEDEIVRIDNLTNNLTSLQKKYDQIEDLDEKSVIINRKIEFCNKLSGVVLDLEDEVRNHIKEKVNRKTKNQFISIKGDEYSDVLLDDEYNVTVIEKNGNDRNTDDISDGIENLLALSFIMALHSINGFDLPLIIDAPFEKLDNTQRLNFIDNLHSFTKDRQVVFLFTDSQYTPEVRANMKNIVLDEYELIKTENKKTIIKPFSR